jgi:hypothetical protein
MRELAGPEPRRRPCADARRGCRASAGGAVYFRIRPPRDDDGEAARNAATARQKRKTRPRPAPTRVTSTEERVASDGTRRRSCAPVWSACGRRAVATDRNRWQMEPLQNGSARGVARRDKPRMEPLWSPVVAARGNRRANAAAANTAHIGENRCRGLRPVAAQMPWEGGGSGSSPEEALQRRRRSALSRSGRLASRRTSGGYGAVYGASRSKSVPGRAQNGAHFCEELGSP